MTPQVLRSDADGVCTLSLNRPDKMNALTTEMFIGLRRHLDSIARDVDRVGAVVLRGAGPCFSAGRDLADIKEGGDPPKPNYFAETIEALADLPQPVITLVHGACFTGALELALAGDMILAAESARFADTHAKWALTPIWGLSQRLPRRIGLAKTYEMVLTCRTYTGAEAAAMGLANMCVPDETLADEARTLTASILEHSWFSHRAAKRLLRETDGLPLEAGLAYEAHRTEGHGPDADERIARFAQRKKTSRSS